MTDNEIVAHILTLKDQVLRWASPKKHDSTNDTYGKGTTTKYGHVKVDDAVDSNSENPAQSKAIVTYVASKINEAKTSLQSSLNIKEAINDSDTHKTSNKYNIPTNKAVVDKLSDYQKTLTIQNTKIESNNLGDANTIPTTNAVWQTITNYEDILVGVDLKKPQTYTGSINNLTTAGYYIMAHNKNSPQSFSYGGERIWYTNALVTIKTQVNRIIQHVCATNKISSASNTNNFTYKLNGCEYTRHGWYDANGNIEWMPWHMYHKPYSKTARVKTLGKNVDNNSVVVYENTAGFIIQWKQTNSNERSYNVHAPLYQYTDVCTFEPYLPITGQYVFGNLIGRMDVKITNDKMQIRTNVAPGGRITGMDIQYFVPRNQ